MVARGCEIERRARLMAAWVVKMDDNMVKGAESMVAGDANC